MKKVELLSPAGDYECFLAALSAGADAVYLGLDKFGARAYAGNLSRKELFEALDISHILGRKIYLTVNTLFKDSEIDELYDFLYEPYCRGLDGVIVQDPGVISAIRKCLPHLPVHVSTQAAITSSEGAMLLKKLGATRIVPARELSLEEIKLLKSRTGLEIECFVHGSMCYCYSGKCLMSSFIGGRSGNRGRCAQPCRLPYSGAYPLSLKDMCTVKMLPKLIDAGITSFKIEGRMKDSGYVHSVTSLYRKYIDRYYENNEYNVDDTDLKELIKKHTRSGGCDGYYFRHNGKSMITPDSPAYVSENSSSAKPLKKYELPKMKVRISCTLKEGCPAEISVENDGIAAKTVTDVIPERAINRVVTEDDVKKQLIRTGGTVFEAGSAAADIEPGLFIPNGRINEIRRQGLEGFTHKILEGFRRSDAVQYSPAVLDRCAPRCSEEYPKVRVSVLNEGQLKAAVLSRADAVIVPMRLLLQEAWRKISTGNCRIYAALPYVIREESRVNSPDNVRKFINSVMASDEISGFYVSNNESLQLLNECGYDGEVIGDIHLYAYNREAYAFYKENGCTGLTVPSELNERELKSRQVTGEELIVYGHLPMMISANCVYSSSRGCENRDAGHDFYLTDRKNEKLYVSCICSECMNVIYNSVSLCITDCADVFDAIRPSSVRFVFTDEEPDEAGRILDIYMSNRHKNGSTDEPITEKYTRGHIKRGVD
ncbi:MAG: U32 family peptidase [Lachnospiraceae bacterium]|nr:U32 family peptidase [Lachnospiraceae bacterium]